MARTPGSFGGFAFDPDVFTSYVAERDPVRSLLIRNGVIQTADPAVASAISEKNLKVTIPFYVPFDGDPLNYDGNTDNVPVEISGNKMSCCGYRRMKAWKEKDFTHELTGANGLAQVARHVGDYQAKCNQKTLTQILAGISGVSAFASHVNNVASADTSVADANMLTPQLALKGMQGALGDHQNEFRIWFMHSAVFTDLCRQNLANNINVMEDAQVEDPYDGYFLGKPVIVDDSLPYTPEDTAAASYTTYLLGTGAFITAPVRIDVPNYTDYDPQTAGGTQMLYTKWGRLIHPYGFSFASDNCASDSPTDAEFATTTNWSMAFDTKNIPIAIFKTNVSL